MNFLLILLRGPQYEWSHSMILIINSDILFICFITRVNNFPGILIVFQEQANYTAADQVFPLKRNNICLRYSVSWSVLSSSEAFVTIGSVYVGACRKCLLHAPIPCLDMKECYKLDFFLVIISLKTGMRPNVEWCFPVQEWGWILGHLKKYRWGKEVVFPCINSNSENCPHLLSSGRDFWWSDSSVCLKF